MARMAPWLNGQLSSLLAQRGHAWLLQGPSGLGQYELALEMVTTWLCEAPTPNGACHQCGSCHAIDVRTHADLCVLMPETTMIELGWPLAEKAQSDIDDKKRKASKEIRVEAMRDAIEFAQRTSARGRGKAVLVFPAERMNAITANALLKTLEEPAGDVKFVLATEAAHQLLPTIRSRCLAHTMLWPSEKDAIDWLADAKVDAADARVLLKASGGRPSDALAMASSGATRQSWSALPGALARGDGSTVSGWAPSLVIDAMQKVCHDLLARSQGAAPRYFEESDLPSANGAGSGSGSGAGTVESLSKWSKQLSAELRTAEHPFNAGLMLESLVSGAKIALNSKHQ